MGSCISENKVATDGVGDVDEIQSKSPSSATSPQSPQSSQSLQLPTNIALEHTKHYQQYCNRQFQISVCSAQGKRTTMDDDHLCQFRFSKHPQYSLFGLFDGHNGSKASKHLAGNLYDTLNDLEDLENNEDIISSIKEMDQHFITNESGNSGSTIVFAIISSNITDNINNNIVQSSSEASETSEHDGDGDADGDGDENSKTNLLDELDIEYSGRIFWCGDSRGILIGSSATKESVPEYNILTTQHSMNNKYELERVNSMNCQVIYGRIHGLLCVTRAFGDCRMKYDGSVLISDCEYETFEAKNGDCLLLYCNELSEKWSDETLVERVTGNLNSEKNKTKAIGNLVDDAISDGSDDNISVLLIQFQDGTKQKTNQKFHDQNKFNL